MARFTNLFISLSILIFTVTLALHHLNTLLIPTHHLSSSSPPSRFDFASAFRQPELDRWRRTNEKFTIDISKQQVQGLLESALTEMEKEMKRERLKGSLPQEKREINATGEPMEFTPLKDKNFPVGADSHVDHPFMSILKGRGMKQGPPELFFFPHGANDPRMLCLRGNSTSDGTQNAYAFVKAVPTGAEMVPGVTLISDSFFDFINPWHSMVNLLQFVYWRIDSGCANADNLLVFHKGEFRTSVGSWIKSLLQACGLPSTTLSSGRGDSHATICFEQAIVSRSGIGGMERPLLRRMYEETRCQARKACHIQSVRKNEHAYDGRVNVTLMVRTGARGFVDEGAWKRVVKEQCEAALNCSWSVMYVANVTFCQQVEALTYTDILVSAHGAQLTNIIFMEPKGRLLEVFPFGWLEMAGHGQFTFKRLASWLDLEHEGYWRDPSTTPCPNLTNTVACFSHYKDQPIGINVTYIGIWLKNVIKKFKDSTLHTLDSSQNHNKGNLLYTNTCECNPKW